jgi:hypothetical protein
LKAMPALPKIVVPTKFQVNHHHIGMIELCN